jgi:hypothetical protein
MSTNTERLDALEAALADERTRNAALTERVAYLESVNAPFEAKRKREEQLALVEACKAVRTVEDFRGLSPKARDLFKSRAYDQQLIDMLRDASTTDRREIVEFTGNRPVVVFALAMAPKVVEVTAHGSVHTPAVKLASGAERDALAALGLSTGRRESGMFNEWVLKSFALDARDRRYLDAEAWTTLLEYDPVLAQLVEEGKWLTVRKLADDEAREHALTLYNERLSLARDERDSRLMPTLPSL